MYEEEGRRVPTRRLVEANRLNNFAMGRFYGAVFNNGKQEIDCGDLLDKK